MVSDLGIRVQALRNRIRGCLKGGVCKVEREESRVNLY